jgi:hypothetical protein
VLVHRLAKLGEQWHHVDVVPLGLGYGPKAVCQDEATTMDHRVHAGLRVVGVVGLQITMHERAIDQDKRRMRWDGHTWSIGFGRGPVISSNWLRGVGMFSSGIPPESS